MAFLNNQIRNCVRVNACFFMIPCTTRVYLINVYRDVKKIERN